ncbi:MAG: hypothetical protein Kow0088_12240 [Anaerolineales bacterium]
MAKTDSKEKDQAKKQKKIDQQPAKSQKAPRQNPPLPYLLDFSFTLASLIVLFAGVITAGLSILHGVSIVMAAVRGCVAIFSLGAVLWLLNYFLANQVIDTAIKDLEAAKSKVDEVESTREVQA